MSDGLAPSERYWVWSLTWADSKSALEGGPGVEPLLGKVDTRLFAKFSNALTHAHPGAPAPDRDLGGAESFGLLLRWLASPDERAFGLSALCLGLSSLDMKETRNADEVSAAKTTLRAGREMETATSLSADPGGHEFASWRAPGHAQLLCSIPAQEVAGLNLGQLAMTLRLFDTQPQRQTTEFGSHWRSFLQAWNLLQFHDVHVTSTERLITAEGAPDPVPVETPQPAAEVEGLRAELAVLAADFEECVGLLRMISDGELAGPEEPTEEFVLSGREEDVDLLWPGLQVALLEGAQDDDRRRFQSAGWLLFDPLNDDPSAIVAAVSSRSEQ